MFSKAVKTPQNNDPIIVIVVLQVLEKALPWANSVCYDRRMPCMTNLSDGSEHTERRQRLMTDTLMTA